MRTAPLLVIALLVLPASAFGQDGGRAPAMTAPAPATAPPPESAPTAVTATSTEDFLAAAARFDGLSVSLARMAATKETRPEVRAFADRLIADHGPLGEAVRGFAGGAEPAKTGAATETRDALAGLDGAAFERAFLDAEAEAVEEAIRAFTGYSESGDSPDVRDFATATLPKLQELQSILAELRS